METKENTRGRGGWAALPTDVLNHVFIMSNESDILCAASVCRNWAAGCNHRAVWRGLCKQRGWPLADKVWYRQKHWTTHKYEHGRFKRTLIHQAGVRVAFTPSLHRFYNWGIGKYESFNNNLVVVGETDQDQLIKVWDLKQRKVVHSFQQSFQWSCAAFGEQRVLVANAQRPQLVSIGLAEPDKVLERTHQSTITCLAYAEQSGLAVSGSYDKTVRVWDLTTAKQLYVLKGNEDRVWSVDITANGKYVASGGDDNLVHVWNLRERDEECARLAKHTDCVMVVQFDTENPDLLFSTGYDAKIYLWNHVQGACLLQFQGHTSIVLSLTITPYVVVSTSRDKTVRIWDRHTGRQLRQLEGHSSDVKCVALSGNNVVSGGYDGLYLWEFDNLDDAEDSQSMAKCAIM